MCVYLSFACGEQKLPVSTNAVNMLIMDEAMRSFTDRAIDYQLLASSIKLDKALEQESNFDALFYPGGHGPLWDLTDDPKNLELIQAFWKAGKPVRMFF